VIDKDEPGRPAEDAPKQTRFRPPRHDSAQDDARALTGLTQHDQAIRTNTPATDADPQGKPGQHE
jgi:hypothetical protein